MDASGWRPAFMINRPENGDTRETNSAEDGGGIMDNGYITNCHAVTIRTTMFTARSNAC